MGSRLGLRVPVSTKHSAACPTLPIGPMGCSWLENYLRHAVHRSSRSRGQAISPFSPGSRTYGRGQVRWTENIQNPVELNARSFAGVVWCWLGTISVLHGIHTIPRLLRTLTFPQRRPACRCNARRFRFDSDVIQNLLDIGAEGDESEVSAKTNLYSSYVAAKAMILETAVDRFLPLDTPYELQLLCAPARSPKW